MARQRFGTHWKPFCLSVSMICLARDGDEAIMDPAPFLDDSVSLRLITMCLKCMAALVTLLEIVRAVVLDENCAVSSTRTLVIVSGWWLRSISLMESSSKFRVIATECAHPTKMPLDTVIASPENPATCMILGARCCCSASESSVAGKWLDMA